jgi:hypothetical protein
VPVDIGVAVLAVFSAPIAVTRRLLTWWSWKPLALTVGDVMLLLCGIGFAIGHAPDPDEPELADRYLSALLDGVLTRGEE